MRYLTFQTPSKPDPLPESPVPLEIPLRKEEELELEYDNDGNPLLPMEIPQPSYPPDTVKPRESPCTSPSKILKQMRIASFLLTVMLFITCQNKSKKITDKLTQRQDTIEIKPFSNPVLIYGSSFAEYFQSLYRNNKYEQMLRFTSDSTVKRFGKQKIHQYYEQKFKFDYALGKLTNQAKDGNVIYLTYSKAHIYATRRKIVIPCVIERDTVKLLLITLDKTPFTK